MKTTMQPQIFKVCRIIITQTKMALQVRRVPVIKQDKSEEDVKREKNLKDGDKEYKTKYDIA